MQRSHRRDRGGRCAGCEPLDRRTDPLSSLPVPLVGGRPRRTTTILVGADVEDDFDAMQFGQIRGRAHPDFGTQTARIDAAFGTLESSGPGNPSCLTFLGRQGAAVCRRVAPSFADARSMRMFPGRTLVAVSRQARRAICVLTSAALTAVCMPQRRPRSSPKPPRKPVPVPTRPQVPRRRRTSTSASATRPSVRSATASAVSTRMEDRRRVDRPRRGSPRSLSYRLEFSVSGLRVDDVWFSRTRSRSCWRVRRRPRSTSTSW